MDGKVRMYLTYIFCAEWCDLRQVEVSSEHSKSMHGSMDIWLAYHVVWSIVAMVWVVDKTWAPCLWSPQQKLYSLENNSMIDGLMLFA